MACGCGGECCKQPKGLGFLWWGGDQNAAEDVYGDYDYLYDYGGNYDGGWSGWDSPGWWDTSGGGSGLDFWGLDDASYWDYYGWNVGPSYSPGTSPGFNVDFGFLPSNTATGAGTYGTSNDNWQGLLDWWNDLVGGVIGGSDAGGGTNPQLPGYCPGGYYHPQNDPFACVPFPPETNAQQRQKAIAAGNAANAAAKAAQAKAQQQAQGCPPNTGLVKNAQGQCVCPPGYAANAQLKKCVLVNASLAAQANQAPDWLKYALLALGAVVVVKAVKK